MSDELSPENGAVFTLPLVPLWSLTMPPECCAHGDVSPSVLKGIILRLNAMTPSAAFKINLGEKKKNPVV